MNDVRHNYEMTQNIRVTTAPQNPFHRNHSFEDCMSHHISMLP